MLSKGKALKLSFVIIQDYGTGSARRWTFDPRLLHEQSQDLGHFYLLRITPLQGEIKERCVTIINA